MNPVIDRFEANSKIPCVIPDCREQRYGLNPRCKAHCEEVWERKRAASAKAVATRRERHPHRFLPNKGNPNYWSNVAHASVAKAVALGILPDLSAGTYACTDCAGVATQYDHRDYGRPLDVQPVCRSCNCKRGSAKYPAASDYVFALLARDVQAA